MERLGRHQAAANIFSSIRVILFILSNIFFFLTSDIWALTAMAGADDAANAVEVGFGYGRLG